MSVNGPSFRAQGWTPKLDDWFLKLGGVSSSVGTTKICRENNVTLSSPNISPYLGTLTLNQLGLFKFIVFATFNPQYKSTLGTYRWPRLDIDLLFKSWSRKQECVQITDWNSLPNDHCPPTCSPRILLSGACYFGMACITPKTL